MAEQYEYLPHRLLRRRVVDIASGVAGELMAVVNENVSDTGAEHWMELAYIRAASGREFTTVVDNVQPADDRPRAARRRRDVRSAYGSDAPRPSDVS
ncbi:hypothetical protein NJL88_20805 [Streptomyces sp. DK15]|uniref:hypothetical protein n=1 Tax=Streptomyces sp. DK15 TaxID=2957499 RepID=UPI0029A1DB83|nr:hypothetical protein [Streptomyces sp. DK15]MDX2392452.1 hypothetical protein [Streptomyces sp. DK15]